MATLEVRTTVAVPPGEVFAFLLDFPSYARYSEHLSAVDRDGDGTVGTDYRLTFSWWRLSYTAHTRVTGVEEPDRIEWQVTRDLDARGRWLVDGSGQQATADASGSATGGGHETDVALVVEYDPDSVDAGRLVDLPRLVSVSWLQEKVASLIEAEGKRVVERVVADLEGERRPVDLDVTVARS